MRIIIMFDLPSVESYEKKEYSIFRKSLIKNGYIMMQFSVYVKCVNTQNRIENEIKKLQKYIPKDGNIRVLEITEKQFSNIKLILGNVNENEKYNGKERYIKI